MKDHLRQLVQGRGPLRGRNVTREYLQARILGALQRTGAMTDLRPFLERQEEIELVNRDDVLRLLT